MDSSLESQVELTEKGSPLSKIFKQNFKMATITEIPDEVVAQTEEVVEIKNESGSEDGDDDVPELEQGDNPQVQMNKQSRQEKKARKSIAKLGLKQVPGITRVVIKKSKTMLFPSTSQKFSKMPTVIHMLFL